MRLIDLSHRIEEGMTTYPGLPAPRLSEFLSREDSRKRYAEGTEFHIGRIEMIANTGTYIDSPFHRYAGAADVAALSLDAIANVNGVLIDGSGNAIDAPALAGIDFAGKAVLVRTGWSRHWGTADYFQGHPFLTEVAAVALRDGGAAIVGIDSLNIDDTSGGTRPVHSILLGAGIPVVEHMTALDQLPGSPFRFFAVPAKVAGIGTWPVRAFAIVEE